MPAPRDYIGRFENFKAPSHIFCLPRGDFSCDCGKINVGIQLFFITFEVAREGQGQHSLGMKRNLSMLALNRALKKL